MDFWGQCPAGDNGQVLGTDDLFAYVEKYRMTLDPHYEDLLGRHQRKPWVKFINPDVQHLCSEEGLNFLSKLLVRQLDIIRAFFYSTTRSRCRVTSCFRCNNRLFAIRCHTRFLLAGVRPPAASHGEGGHGGSLLCPGPGGERPPPPSTGAVTVRPMLRKVVMLG